MSDRVNTVDVASQPAEAAGVETIESYETEMGVVLYDAENPLAWVEATTHMPVKDHR